jgi:hypothetical protein
MGKVFIQGLALAIAGFVAIALNNLLDLGLGSIVFGLLVGGVLGLVSDGGPVGRIGGFLVGVLVALIMYLVRVLFLNDSFAGQVVGLLVSLAIVTVICALTAGRLPLWSALLGSALVVGAYETSFIDNPANVQSELLQYTTMALVPAALGFLAAIFVADKPEAPDGRQNTDNNQEEQSSTVSLSKNEG